MKNILEQHKKWLDTEGREGKRANLRYTDLRGADLRGANLRRADLRDADLRDAYLRGADLRGANLRRADLCCANLRGAYLRGADLRDADLRTVNMRVADLRGADLRGADLRGADLRYARLPEGTHHVSGFIYNIFILNGDTLRAGCQCHSFEKWKKFTQDEILEMDSHKAVEFYPTLLKIIDMVEK